MAEKTRDRQRKPNRLLSGVNTPFDLDLFVFYLEVADRAASGDLADSHIPPPSGPGMHLTNNPVNRAMAAVSRECEGLPNDARFALMWRVLDGHKLLTAAKNDPRFVDRIFVDESGDTSLSHDLIRAYGSVPLIIDGDDTRPDMDAIWAETERLSMLEDGGA